MFSISLISILFSNYRWKTSCKTIKNSLLKPYLVEYQSSNIPEYYTVNKWVDNESVLKPIGLIKSNVSLDGLSDINMDFIVSKKDRQQLAKWLILIKYVDHLEKQFKQDRLALHVFLNNQESNIDSSWWRNHGVGMFDYYFERKIDKYAGTNWVDYPHSIPS